MSAAGPLPRGPRRRPAQTALIALAVLIGGLIGIRVWSAPTSRPEPDILIEHATADALHQAGFQRSESEPTTWRDISLRLKHAGPESLMCLRCTIAPDEVDRLLAWPIGSRRPVTPAPPTDWPWQRANGLNVPAWWQPNGGRARMYELPSANGHPAVGLFANYEPASQQLHLWQWQSQNWHPARSSPLQQLVADELIAALAADCAQRRQPTDRHGWLSCLDLPSDRCGFATTRLPAKMTGLSAFFLPHATSHRYLLAIRGLDESSAWQLVGEQPLHPYPADSAAPTARWSQAMPPDGLPAWFSPGVGPRRIHVLARVGSGRVDAARWCAYDTAARTLFVWDWNQPDGADPHTDMTPSP